VSQNYFEFESVVGFELF